MTPDDSTRRDELSAGLSRRRFLVSLGATAAVAGAGCLESGDDTSEYTDWVPADDGVTFGMVDLDVAAQTEGDSPGLLPFLFPAPQDGDGGEQPVELPGTDLRNREDPLLATPFEISGAVLAGGFFGLWSTGLSYLTEREESAAADRILSVDGVGVATGTFDTERADERLRASPDTPFGGSAYEQVDETDQFTHYEVVDSDDGVPRVAVSRGRILFAESRAAIERIVETGDGDRTRAVDAFDRFARFVETVGDAQFVAGWHSILDEAILLGDTDDWGIRELLAFEETDFVTSVSLNPDESSLTTDIVTRRDALSAESTEQLREQLGGQSQAYSVTAEDGQLSMSGTYDEISFTPLGQDWTDDLPSGEDLPAEITEAVPDSAIEFSDATDRPETLRVTLTRDLAVDELTARAINADSEVRLQDPGRGDSFTISPDADGDEVRIVVTVDDVSGVVASTEYP